MKEEAIQVINAEFEEEALPELRLCFGSFFRMVTEDEFEEKYKDGDLYRFSDIC